MSSPSKPRAARPADARARRYHHGNLRQALLESAEQILREQGVAGLKLRAIAKRAGVSHTAADPHFGDLVGLLSELAAIGYERLAGAMAGAPGSAPQAAAIARGYIGFAAANPDLFALMFRGDTLDMGRPRLQQAAQAAFLALAAAAGSPADQTGLSLAAGGRMAASWAVVHGLSMLLIDDRLSPILRRIAPQPAPDALIEAALGALSFAGGLSPGTA